MTSKSVEPSNEIFTRSFPSFLSLGKFIFSMSNLELKLSINIFLVENFLNKKMKIYLKILLV